ncbi:ATP-dependent RNA helicase [Podosphaera aphanis]|nr:ATP-dependent RNA helicase [Podosphaera aphanis]
MASSSIASSPLLYACIAYNTTILTEYTTSVSSQASNFAPLVLSNISHIESKKVTYSHNSYFINYLADAASEYPHSASAGGLTYLVVTNPSFGQRIPFSFLFEVKKQFLEKFPAESTDFSSLPIYGAANFNNELKSLMAEYSKPDAIQSVQGEIAKVRGIMCENIDSLLERGDRIDLLVDKTDRLGGGAYDFRLRSRRLRRKMWWNNIKLMSLLVLTIVFLVYLFVGFACGLPGWSKCIGRGKKRSKPKQQLDSSSGYQREKIYPSWSNVHESRSQQPSYYGSSSYQRGPYVLNSQPPRDQNTSTYSLFGELLQNEIRSLLKTLCDPKNKHLIESWGIISTEYLESKMVDFRSRIIECVEKAEEGAVSKDENPLFFRLRKAFVKGNLKGLTMEVKYSFLSSVASKKFSPKEELRLQELADLRFPAEWYPSTRALQRTVHLHVGPTNSGKTYHALQKLEAATNGVYAGPLRLLAHEVYSRFNAKGKLCGLITGEEKRIPPELTENMYSCTVEMIPLNVMLDVAVIDEIQMITSPDRGWAWTSAFLGVQAKEVHLCGEIRTKKLIEDLCALVGDKLVIHEYERLSPLELETDSINGDLSKLRKGDAVILFSRLAIHGMKQEIEKKTGKRCAVVYGSLPPETRAQQAALFNNPNNDYDYLVASDAVGMGLNLSIRRIIFESTLKFDGTERRVMETSEIKQIAGRAGRYKTANDDVKIKEDTTTAPEPVSGLDLVPVGEKKEPTLGLVTTLSPSDFETVRKSMIINAPFIKSAGIAPNADIILRFASYFPPSTPFSYILLRLFEISSIRSPFSICMLRDEIIIADLIQSYNLSSRDRLTFTAAPTSTNDPATGEIIKELASCVASQSGGELLNMKTFKLELLDIDINDHPLQSKGYLREAEALHKALTLYLWLSYRFAGVFISQALAFHVKSLLEAKIDECLATVTYNPERRKKSKKKSKERAVLEAMLESADDEKEQQPLKAELEPKIKPKSQPLQVEANLA